MMLSDCVGIKINRIQAGFFPLLIFTTIIIHIKEYIEIEFYDLMLLYSFSSDFKRN